MDLGAELGLVAQYAKPEQVGSICKQLDPAWVEEAVVVTGTASLRRRRLPAELVLWLVLGMALMRNRPIWEIVDKLGLALPGAPVAKSSIAEARQRLGDAPLAWLFSRTADEWAHRSASGARWNGLRVYGMDGTTMRVPDSDANREYYGGPTSGRGDSGYPQLRLVALVALRAHLIAAAEFGPYENGETTLASELWRHVPQDSIVIVDKGYWGANILMPLELSGGNRHWLTRGRKDLRWTAVKRLGRGDELVEINVSPEARKKRPDLPALWTVRVVRYQRKGFRPQRLVTSLTDATRYRAKDLVELYHERWEVELVYDDVKTEMLEREEAIRSQSPRGVSQEVLGILLAHNLVRLEMERVAKKAGVDPLRLSFSYALRAIRDEWCWSAISRSPGAIPRHLEDLATDLTRFLLPPRRERRVIRGVKIKMTNYARVRRADRAAAARKGA